jgi:hypothetical protein
MESPSHFTMPVPAVPKRISSLPGSFSRGTESSVHAALKGKPPLPFIQKSWTKMFASGPILDDNLIEDQP